MGETMKFYVLNIVMLLTATTAGAQCEIINKAFNSDESITYDLYFNSGLLKPKAGTGSLTTQKTLYKDKEAFMLNMHLSTSGLIKGFFKMNDTLTSYVDMNLRPLYFSKNAEEGKHYSMEKQTYRYTDDEIEVHTRRIYDGKQRFDEILTTQACTYDYLSVLVLIRNLDYADMNPGDFKHIQFVTGKKIVNMIVNYHGKSKVKANDRRTYSTIDLSMEIYDDAFKDKKEAISASLTDDVNRIPVIINTHIKVGVIKAVMKSMEN